MHKNTTEGNRKHLTIDERFYIEKCLNDGLNFKSIAELTGRHPKTLSREIRGHRTARSKDPNLRKSWCAYLESCTITNLCSNKFCRKTGPCSKCRLRTCAQYCESYVPGTCPKLHKPPYICNGCRSYRTCGYDKMYYRGKLADDAYHENMSVSRQGINMTPEELHELDKLVSPLLLKGQSLAHIYASHSSKIKCSKRTLYDYIDSGVLTVRNIDLPRKVKYKPRKKHRKVTKISYEYRVGRTYEQFLSYAEQHSDLTIVEMDTVIGTKGGKTLLTLLFRSCNFMAIFLLEENTQKEVTRVFDELEHALGTDGFKQMFPIVLTDNGPEFKDPVSLETNSYGDIRTRIFYCDPHKSWQKARIEKNHEFIRYILPGGRSFNRLTQENVTLMANHINSVARASLNERTPRELADLLLNKDFLSSFGYDKISSDEVLLKPELLKK